MKIEEKFREHELDCRAHQAKHSALAKDIRDQNPPTGWEDYDRGFALKIDAHEKSAATWGRRAEAASRLMFLVDHTSSDPEIMALHFDHQHQAMYNWAIQHHRVEYADGSDGPMPTFATARGAQT